MAAIFFADSAGTQGTGTGVSAANACTLKQFVEDDVILHTARAAGDLCWVKNGTTITYDGSVAVFATAAVAGSVDLPVRVEGYATTTGDDGVVVINDSDAGATRHCINHGAIGYWHWENFKITNPRSAFTTTTANGMSFMNIEVDSPITAGFGLGTSTGDLPLFQSCYVHDGSSIGFDVPTRAPRFIDCVAINNGGDGFEVGAGAYGSHLINCLSHSNGGRGFDVSGESTLVNCVANRNTSDGMYVTDSDHPTIFTNCGSTSNGGYGINGVSGTIALSVNCGFNPTNETNTSGKSHANVTLYEKSEVTGDPDYTDSNPATATDVDLSISSSSAWKATGAGLGGVGFTATVNSIDVGVAQRVEPVGGGGGMLTHPGMVGGIRG